MAQTQEYHAVFYTNYFSTTPFEKTKVLSEINKVEDVTSFSQVEFGIDTDVVGIIEWNRVEIIRVDRNETRVVFEGVISFMSFTIDRIFVRAIDGKGYLKEKVFISTLRFHDDVDDLACPISSSASLEYSV